MSDDSMSNDSMSDDWKVYRTRFLVRAKQLTQPLMFTDPLGREHRGKPGDYIVQSSEGLLRIAQQEIFEDVYVPLFQPSSDVIPNRTPMEGGEPALNGVEAEPYPGLHPRIQSAKDVQSPAQQGFY